MTEHEAQALIQLLQRTPMTAAESLWCQQLIDRLTRQEDSHGTETDRTSNTGYPHSTSS